VFGEVVSECFDGNRRHLGHGRNRRVSIGPGQAPGYVLFLRPRPQPCTT
jgi:hypothetical protein